MRIIGFGKMKKRLAALAAAALLCTGGIVFFARGGSALPAQARAYVDFLEAELGVPIKLVSTGPKRHENAVRRP